MSPRSSSLRPHAVPRAVGPLPLALVSDDDRVVERIRAGDERALEAVYAAHYEALHGFAMAYVGSADVAEEVIQDVFLEVWAHRATWQVSAGIRAYLFGAVRNRALNAVRRLHLEDRVFARDAAAAMLSAPAVEATDLRAYAAELEGAVRRAVARLPERMRLVVTLRWRHGLSHAEIAAVAGITVKGVEKQMGRAIASLRKALVAYSP